MEYRPCGGGTEKRRKCMVRIKGQHLRSGMISLSFRKRIFGLRFTFCTVIHIRANPDKTRYVADMRSETRLKIVSTPVTLVLSCLLSLHFQQLHGDRSE